MSTHSWFRMYHEFATDPKVQMLSEVDQRRFVMLLCLRCCNGDVTLQDVTVAFQMRISGDEWADTKGRLIERKLITKDNKPTAWEKRQMLSDDSKSRVYKWREKQKRNSNGDCNVTVTPQDTDTDTDKDIKLVSTRVAEPTAHDILSGCLSDQTAKDLIAHRKKLRKPLTARAAKLLARDFVAFGNPEEAAEMMIKNGWQGFHPTWVANQTRAGPSKSQKGWGSLYAELNGFGHGNDQKRIDENVPLLSGGSVDGAGNRDGDIGGLPGDVIELFAGDRG